MEIDYVKRAPKEEQTKEGRKIFQDMRDYLGDKARTINGFYYTKAELDALLPFIHESKQLVLNTVTPAPEVTYKTKVYTLVGQFSKIPMYLEKPKAPVGGSVDKIGAAITKSVGVPEELKKAQEAVEAAKATDAKVPK